jgi:hypothetical protein
LASLCTGLASAAATFGDHALTRTTGGREHVRSIRPHRCRCRRRLGTLHIRLGRRSIGSM